MANPTHKNKHMHSLLQYIEDNLAIDLDTKLLSGIGFSSHAKLYRGFYNLTGHSVKEYIRKRRLSNALALIKMSHMALTDIAHQSGYSSHQALCRAVRQNLNLTPTQYKNGDTYYFFPPWSGDSLQPVTVSQDTIPKTLRILFYSPVSANIEDLAVSTLLKLIPAYNGRIFGKNGMQNSSNFCYELYLTETHINYSLLTFHNFKIAQTLPSYTTTFATATVQNNAPKINAVWDYLYSQWLQNSMFEYTAAPYFEEYILRNGKPYKLKLFLPIRKRNEDTKISLIGNPCLHFITAQAKGYNAEKIASLAVFNYVSVNHPHIIGSSKDLYLSKHANSYTCGIRVDSELHAGENKNIACFTTGQDNYLMLESRVMGDYDRYLDMLLCFARINGISADRKGIFAVYDGSEGFDNLKIKMYCPVRFDTK